MNVNVTINLTNVEMKLDNKLLKPREKKVICDTQDKSSSSNKQYQIHTNHKEKEVKVSSVQENKRDLKKCIQQYEPRVDINFNNHKINELVGWLIIIFLIMLVLSYLTMENTQMISLLFVTTYLISHFNWVSKKMMYHS